MTNPHTSAAIAQVVFYVPIVPISAYVLSRNWNNRPRAAWYPLITFSLLRLAGGILTIILESDPENLGLNIAASVLLSVGVIPLLIATVGIIRLILKSSTDENKIAASVLKLIKVSFAVAIGLLIASGVLSGSPQQAAVAKGLSRAAYAIFIVVVLLVATELVHLYGQRCRLAAGTEVYIYGALAAIPALTLRVIYGLLQVFAHGNAIKTWNPLGGSAVAFALMCLLPEYITVLIYLHLGFRRMWQFKNVEE